MPLYDYECAACGRRFEVMHGVHDAGPTTCPLCGKGPVRKAFAAPAIHFKGSGWAKKERRTAARKSSTDKSESSEPTAGSTPSPEGSDASSKDSGTASTTSTSPASD